ncbi:glycosyltransferase family 4 protein [Candidatus Auribacterota bacterium]
MKIVFLTQATEQGASSRYRVYQYIPHLEKAGIECLVLPAIPKSVHKQFFYSKCVCTKIIVYLYVFLKRLFQIPKICSADIVFIQKPVLPYCWPVIERLIKLCGKKIVFDLDDAIFYRSPKWGRADGEIIEDPNFKRIMRLSDAVLAGNEYLAYKARQFNSNVHVLPTVIDTDHYKYTSGEARETEKIVIGWIGSPTTLFYIDGLREVFQRLAKEREFVLKIVGAVEYSIPGVDIICEDWYPEKEIEQLRSFDIGIAPLIDDEWSSGKCGLKMLLYMACGVPVVASPYGVNGKMIDNNKTGILVEIKEEWHQKLKNLMDNADVRDKLRHNARAGVESSYSLKRSSEIFIKTMFNIKGEK